LQKKDFSVHLLVEEVFEPFSGLSGFKEGQDPKDLFFFVTKLLRGQLYVQGAEVEEGVIADVLFRKVRGRRQLRPSLLPRNNQSKGWGCRRREYRY